MPRIPINVFEILFLISWILSMLFFSLSIISGKNKKSSVYKKTSLILGFLSGMNGIIAITSKLDSIHADLDLIQERLSSIETKLNSTDQSLDSIEVSLGLAETNPELDRKLMTMELDD